MTSKSLSQKISFIKSKENFFVPDVRIRFFAQKRYFSLAWMQMYSNSVLNNEALIARGDWTFFFFQKIVADFWSWNWAKMMFYLLKIFMPTIFHISMHHFQLSDDMCNNWIFSSLLKEQFSLKKSINFKHQPWNVKICCLLCSFE